MRADGLAKTKVSKAPSEEAEIKVDRGKSGEILLLNEWASASLRLQERLKTVNTGVDWCWLFPLSGPNCARGRYGSSK